MKQFNWSGVRDEHLMQCFEEDTALVEAVGMFTYGALARGDAGIVVSTEEHRAKVNEYLAGRGLDPATLQRAGRYISLDAEETLERICDGNTPNTQKFFEVIGQLISRAANSWPGVRVFGEMVNLLWLQGKYEEALELERLWNRLAKVYPFALFCAYSREAFGEGGECFSHVCEEHSMVVL